MVCGVFHNRAIHKGYPRWGNGGLAYHPQGPRGWGGNGFSDLEGEGRWQELGPTATWQGAGAGKCPAALSSLVRALHHWPSPAEAMGQGFQPPGCRAEWRRVENGSGVPTLLASVPSSVKQVINPPFLLGCHDDKGRGCTRGTGEQIPPCAY